MVITDRGRAAYVLLSATAYDDLTDKRSIVEWLRSDDGVESEPARLTSPPRAADL